MCRAADDPWADGGPEYEYDKWLAEQERDAMDAAYDAWEIEQAKAARDEAIMAQDEAERGGQ